MPPAPGRTCSPRFSGCATERRGIGSASAAGGGRARASLLRPGRLGRGGRLSLLRPGVDQSEPPRGKVYAVFRLAARGRLAAHRGEMAEALELASRAVELAERSDWLNYRARAWLALAEVQRASGQNAEAAVAAALRLYEAKGNVAAIARLSRPALRSRD